MNKRQEQERKIRIMEQVEKLKSKGLKQTEMREIVGKMKGE